MLGRETFKSHTDDVGFDEIRIRMVPRYKMSGLSGNEWRVSAHIEFMRKGRVLATEVRTQLKYAAAHVPWLLDSIGERVDWIQSEKDDAGLCQQVGCSEKSIAVYRIKQGFCVGGGNCGQKMDTSGYRLRRFCRRHLRRGDCDLEDADINYEIVSGPGPEDGTTRDSDESHSIVMPPITLGSAEGGPTPKERG